MRLFRRKPPQHPMDDLSRARLSRCIEELKLLEVQCNNTREQLAVAIDALHFCAMERSKYSLDSRILQARTALKQIVGMQ